MKWFTFLLCLGLGACGKSDDSAPKQEVAAPAVATVAGQPSASKAAAMQPISVPKDKAQLDRMVAMGYTVHEDHMHPPGVKECALDKAGGSVIQ